MLIKLSRFAAALLLISLIAVASSLDTLASDTEQTTGPTENGR